MNKAWKAENPKCRSCGKPIVWMKTKAGKNMPCDKDLVLYREDEKGKDTVINHAGEVVRCSFQGDKALLVELGRVPHWATCDRPDQFRKGGQAS